MKRISCDQAYMMLKSNNKVVVLDLRHKADYEKGHIPRAININAYEVSKEIPAIIKDKTTPILIYCYSGSVSVGVGLVLEDLGYKFVFDLKDIDNWKYKLIT